MVAAWPLNLELIIDKQSTRSLSCLAATDHLKLCGFKMTIWNLGSLIQFLGVHNLKQMDYREKIVILHFKFLKTEGLSREGLYLALVGSELYSQKNSSNQKCYF